MSYKKCILFFCPFWAFFTTAQSVDSLVALYNSRIPQEKLYIQFDNTVYSPGETVWFKAYMVQGFEPSGLSKNLYIGWFDDSGKLINRTIAPIINSVAWGNFTIPPKLSGRQVQVIAYTPWMLNFDSTLLFRRNLTVVQPLLEENNQHVMPVATLRFFPEGGDMVENISCNVAFKAQNQAGMPVQVSGFIKDKKGDTVTRFSSEHDGMGMIELIPRPGEIYTAEWINALNEIQHTSLPIARPAGVVLKMDPYRPGIVIERNDRTDARLNRISIVAAMNQQVLYRANVDLTKTPRITGRITTDKFPSGILQVTLFDANKQPLAERIWFVDNDNYRLTANIRADTLSTAQRGKNVYRIDVPDSVATSLSLAITDGDTEVDSTRNIFSQLLLSGDIRGYVHNPAYYFSSKDINVVRHRNLVMLTNGWRRFRWENVLNAKTPEILYPIDTTYLSLTGKIDRIRDARIKKAELLNMILVSKDSSKQLIFAPLETDGSFHEKNLLVFDTVKVYYQLNKTVLPARSQVSMRNSFMQLDSTQKLAGAQSLLPDTTGLARILSIAQRKRTLDSLMALTTLKEVVVTSRTKTRKQQLDERYASSLFAGDNGYQFAVADDKTAVSYMSALLYLQGKVGGLDIKLTPRGIPLATWRGSSTALFLDEMRIDAETLSTITMSSIAYIKVIRAPFVGATGNAPGGAIAVYTKKAEDMAVDLKSLDYLLLPGYTPIREFYAPDHGEQRTNMDHADLRRTLLWNPIIQTNAREHQIQVSFYNNDISRSFRIVLEGISEDGRLLHFSKLLK